MSYTTITSVTPRLELVTLSSRVTRNPVNQPELQLRSKELRSVSKQTLNLPDEVQQILVNMMFNMGRTRLSKFKKFNAAIQEGDWKTAAVEGRDSLWYRQVTNRAERLMSRMENV